MATRIPRNQAEFTVAELLAATGGTLAVRGAAERSTSISTNTRELVPGAAFVALRGPTHDGHAHLGAAAAAGAPLALVEREVEAPPTMTLVRVDSTLRALGDLARAHVERWQALGERTVVGITGSAGKTTTRVATAALVESLFPGELVATRGNLNNRIGVPMMLFSLDAGHRVCVVELGTSEPGEIAELCRMARPDVGILTLVAAAHLEGLGSIDGVEREKAALFGALSPEGIAVGNGDDARVRRALAATPATRRVTYGRGPAAEVRVVERTPLGMTSSRVVITRADGRRSAFETPLVGEAGALACAGAVAAVEAALRARLDGDQLTDAFRRVQLGEGAARLVPHQLSSGLAVLDDTYNANPASMAFSIGAAAEMAAAMNRRLVLVLGEMAELGREAAPGHDEVGRAAAESGAGLVVAVGGGEAYRVAEGARARVPDVLFAPSVDEGLRAILDAVGPSDLVLVKGSRAVGADRIVAELVRRHGPPSGEFS
jgi:UDP-N-acetylmuramoyl-tripeptide--D-alanyl-D-alanine ligase